MYTVYVLKSLKNGKRYVGYTSFSARKRLNEHNNKKNSFTSKNIPWILIYSEKFLSHSESIQREKFLKSGQGRKYLDNMK